MPEHIKDANKDSEEFTSYLKGFVDSRLKDNQKKSREAVKEKARKFAANIAIMLAG